jgi:hypothetical protein
MSAARTQGQARATARRRSLRPFRRVIAAFLLVGACLAGRPGLADEHDPQRAGHPLRIVAYVLHPVGVILDVVIFRPAHWLVSYEPMKTLFGHED